MQNIGLSLIRVVGVMLLFCWCSSCNNQNSGIAVSETIAIHNPVYPKPGTSVNFSLFLINDYLPKEVKLSISLRNLRTDNTWSDESEVYSESWVNPVNFPLTTLKTDGFPEKSLVTYKYEVKCNDRASGVYYHRVTFATNPYPFSTVLPDEDKQPAPVYVTANVNRACNVVFIPDADLTGVERRPDANWEDYFYNSVRDNIRNGIFSDKTTRKHIIGFNFFINPISGKTISEGSLFNQPVNQFALNFADGKCFIHNTEFTDYANPSPLMKCYTSRIYNKGTFMHESGHVLFHLADEYEFGNHWYDGRFPNNWRTETDARNAVSYLGLRNEHVYLLSEPYAVQKCYILCPNAGCQMGLSGLSPVYYCKPCIKAVGYYMEEYITP
jgi:hypothetical protein